MIQYFCMTNCLKRLLKTKTAVHMKRLFQGFLKRFHLLAQSLEQLVLKAVQRLNIISFTTLSVVSWPCLKLSLCWRMCFSFLLLTKLLQSLQWGQVEGLECNLHRSKQTVEVLEYKGFDDLLEARNLKVAFPSFTTHF